ncbi:MAG: hypothetical protein A2252_08300 [Elusimicrobia bacterium RIFOXYA2_FULL_39_19]|nr:MAG: hypothetical protein A2252_08300 [Elusimicrobia bacterium RIFOXYA2_FULL_39_19]
MKKKTVLFRFLKNVYPHWFITLVAAFFGVTKFLLPLLIPWMLKLIIDTALNSSLPVADRAQYVTKICLFMLGISVILGIVSFFRSYFAAFLRKKVILELQYKLFTHIQRMSMNYFDRQHVGNITSYIINDINSVQSFVGEAIISALMDTTLLIVLVVILLKLNLVLGLIAISIFPFFFIAMKVLSPRIKKTSHQIQKSLAEISGSINEKFSGIKVLQAFSQEENEAVDFQAKIENYHKRVVEGSKWQAMNVGFSTLFTTFAPALIIWYGAYQLINGSMTIGTLMAFYSYLGSFYFPLTRLSELNVVLQSSLAAMERIYDVFDTVPNIKEIPGALKLSAVKGAVEFNNVSFGYTTGKTVLENISLKVNPGEVIAFVGPSGAGKSTIVNLIPRFYDPSAGEILIDTTDIKKLTIKSLRDNIGIVTQDVILFSGTIKENMMLGKKHASCAEINEALKMANAFDFIDALPKNLNSEIGERGVTLSGGQKQRLSIARMFLKNPPIIILDEATSALDSVSEAQVQEALERLFKNRTTFIIAHRLSTIKKAHRIIVIDKGTIVEEGKHEELLAKAGLYARLYREQFQKESN